MKTYVDSLTIETLNKVQRKHWSGEMCEMIEILVTQDDNINKFVYHTVDNIDSEKALRHSFKMFVWESLDGNLSYEEFLEEFEYEDCSESLSIYDQSKDGLNKLIEFFGLENVSNRYMCEVLVYIRDIIDAE